MDVFSQQIFRFGEQTQLPFAKLRQQQNVIRECQYPGAFHLIDQYVRDGLALAEDAGGRHLDALQECYLLMVYHTLLDTSLDSLLPRCWRIGCLDHLYKPMFALRRYYAEQPDGERKICSLCYDLKVNADYSFNADR